jgi:hypothetical protein
MKCMLWTIVMAALFVLSAAPASAPAADNDTPTVEQIEIQEMLLLIKAREAEFEHKQSMQALELEERRIRIERMRGDSGWTHKRRHGHGLLFLVILVAHILLTVWVYKDMNEQQIGRALWVPITLLAGVFGAILYAIVRNADISRVAKEAEEPE